MSAVAPGPVSTLPEPLDPLPTRWRWRWVVATLVAVAVGVAVWGGHEDLLRALELLGSARPGWLLAALAAVVVWCAGWTGVYVGALSVVRRVGWRALGDHAQTSVAAVALNSAVKSGGMAGLAPFLQLGRRRGVPDTDVAAGYLLATVAADVGFLLVVGATVVVLAADGDLSGADLWAGGVFLLLLALRLGLLVGAARNPAVLRRVLGVAARLRARVLRRPAGEPDLQRADQVAAALRQASARPGRVLLPIAAATVVDLAAVAMLYAAVAAVGGGTDLRLALVAYVSSGLFAAIGPLPGGLGVVEVGTVAVLVAGGLPLAEATAAVALFRLAEFWLPLALGGLAWARTRRRGPVPAPVPLLVPDVRRPADGRCRANAQVEWQEPALPSQTPAGSEPS